MSAAARHGEYSGGDVLFVALELASKKWKVGSTVGGGQRPREKDVRAGDLRAVVRELALAKQRFGLPDTAQVVSCYEAGRDGFWLRRFLHSIGVRCEVVDPGSIEVSRRKRRAKTDRLDVVMLLRALMRWWCGDSRVWRVVRVPGVEDEDARQLHRELETLKRERTRHSNRIKALLVTQGIRDVRIGGGFREWLREVRLWDGLELPGQLRSRLERECERLELVRRQIRDLERQRLQALRQSKQVRVEKARRMMQLRGIGATGGWTLAMEYFWREFSNRREVGAAAGLTPTPFDSGESSREQGIDKCGSLRVRTLMIELAWGWIRFQPRSELTQWFQKRFAAGGKRARQIGIVGVARRLLISLWRFLEHGIVPAGAVLKPV